MRSESKGSCTLLSQVDARKEAGQLVWAKCGEKGTQAGKSRLPGISLLPKEENVGTQPAQGRDIETQAFVLKL